MSLSLPTVSVTTRHSASLYPWQLGSGLPAAGPILGLNLLADGGLFSYDPWECYAAGIVTSPNMVVLGQLGKGKSALVKTYLSRQLLAGRQAYVLDPKGEYAPLADARGLPRLCLSPGGADRLNPLDATAGDDPEAVTRRRAAVIGALAATGLGRDLSAEERSAIGVAATDLPAVPTLPDVVARLFEPSAAMAEILHTTPQVLAVSVRQPALELRRLLAGDLAGMVDAPSTVELDPDGTGIVVDLSAAFGTDALATVMVCAGAWLSSAIARPSPRRRLLLVDEAWALLSSSATTAWLQGVSKLARRHGVSLVTVVHRCSDLSGQADAGTATQAQARGLLADAETRVIYGQPAGERAAAAELLDLSEVETELVTRLPAHRALWRIGAHAAVIDHILTIDEARDLIDTDAQMRVMTAIRVAAVALGLVALAVFGVDQADRHRDTVRATPPASSTPSTLTAADRAAITTNARRFTRLVGSIGPPARRASLSTVATTQLAHQIVALPATPPASTAASTTRAVIRSVDVLTGPPVTALVLATLIMPSAGSAPAQVPEAWTLTLVDTSAGWRVAGVQS